EYRYCFAAAESCQAITMGPPVMEVHQASNHRSMGQVVLRMTGTPCTTVITAPQGGPLGMQHHHPHGYNDDARLLVRSINSSRGP
ncbi:MAG: hypothetical protein JWN15_2360, partial [Firmicutes bacterium]|nr:hypothetical protein [Bacillota bacterium]